MTPLLWLIFFVLVGGLIAVDLGLLTRRPRVIKPIEAVASTALWLLGAFGFGLLLAQAYEREWLSVQAPFGQTLTPHDIWLQYVTTYCVEMSLSLDNVTVLAMILATFQVEPAYRSRLLFWTTILSLVLRACLIQLGVVLLQWAWMNWVFAGLLALATIRVFAIPDDPTRFENKRLVKLARRIPVSAESIGQRLVVAVDGRIRLTPFMAACLAAVAADLASALDSVPAAFAITRQPLVAVSANAFAVMALRSLYFLLAGLLERPRYLKIGLTIVLLGLAVKTVMMRYDDLATVITLAGVLGVVGLSMLASNRAARRSRPARPTPMEDVVEAVEISRRNLWKVIILMAGTIILLAAVAIAPLPGPGFIILAPIGLAVLGTEFLWARSVLGKLKSQTAALQNRAETLAARSSLWMIPPVVIGYWVIVTLLALYGPIPSDVVWLGSIGGFFPVGYWAFRAIWPRRGPKSHPARTD